MSFLQRKVLLLNKTWHAIGICTVRRSLKLVFKQDASIIEYPGYKDYSWEEWRDLPYVEGCEYIRTSSIMFRVPEVIQLYNYNNFPQKNVNYGKRALFKRDDNTCCYCGERHKTMTTDHVIPRAQGGKTSWDNCVTACLDCNSLKGNRTPEQAGMKLRVVPKKPKFVLFKEDIRIMNSWKHFIDESQLS